MSSDETYVQALQVQEVRQVKTHVARLSLTGSRAFRAKALI